MMTKQPIGHQFKTVAKEDLCEAHEHGYVAECLKCGMVIAGSLVAFLPPCPADTYVTRPTQY